jgi:subtilisin family serine protease
MRRGWLTFVCSMLLIAAVAAQAGPIRRAHKKIAGSYIVTLKADAGDPDGVAARHAARGHARIRHVYRSALLGYSAEMSEMEAAALSDDPDVLSVEEDFEVTADAVESGAVWGIDRVDQRDLPLSGTYTYNFDGSGVHAYIIDTGIYAAHPDFGGRVGAGFTAINDGNGTNDCNGHGTHVSGTVGSHTYGIAKNVTLHPVRVLGCDGSGSGSGVIAGIDWVRQNAIHPAVANMSLGGGASQAEDDAVTNAVNSGVVFAVAAGNSNLDACTTSPARAPAALTVGASTSSDARASFSNWGTCVDLFAPGSGIISTSNTGGTANFSGTSMASPHVTGVAALYAQQYPGNSAASIASMIVNAATTGHLSTIGTGSPNRLLYSLTATATGGFSSSTWYRMINRNSAKCLDARGSGTANGTAVQQYTCNGSNAQSWQLLATDSGYYRVNTRNATAQGLDVNGVSTADGALIHLWAYGGGANQQWSPQSLGGGYYRVVARHSGKCLDVPGASTADSVQLQQWTCNATNAQSFTIAP